MSINKNDYLTVFKLKELLEVIDTNRKASLAIWYVTAHDADLEALNDMQKVLKDIDRGKAATEAKS